MFRKDLIPVLESEPLTLNQIARRFQVDLRSAEADLKHLSLSLKHLGRCLEVTPARCKQCDFTYPPEKLKKPSKCPHCGSTRIHEAWIRITEV